MKKMKVATRLYCLVGVTLNIFPFLPILIYRTINLRRNVP